MSKNYKENGGDKWVVGGTLEIKEGASFLVEGKPFTGGTLIESQEESNATTVAALRDDFNELLVKLKAAGLMK
uniref:Head fiber protein n=1 Tax=Proteinivorax hydrogeniformans TaxID=1826727 RepID=UPI003EB8619A